MSHLKSWLLERLMPINEAAFIHTTDGHRPRHRQIPELCQKNSDIHFFRVPLAGGTGTAFLAEPKLTKKNAPTALVFLLHGMGDDCTYPHWHWIEALNARGLSVLSLDWDGHGVGGDSILDLQSSIRSLPLILQKIYGQPGDAQVSKMRQGPPCFLMGHSTGAVLALLSATRSDLAKLVKGIIAVSPSVVVNSNSKMSREALSFLNPMAWVEDFLWRIPYYGMKGIFPAFGNYRRKDFPIRVKVGIYYADQVRQFVHETFEVRRMLRDVKVPVLWLHGARDKIVPLDAAAKLMCEIPTAKFLHIDDTRGHLRMVFSQAIPNYAAKFIETSLQQG